MFEPARVSTSRIKRMTQPFWSQYRLRVGVLRVYYDVDDVARRVEVGQNEDVLRNGKPVALVVPFDDDDLEWYAAEHDPMFIQSIARAREQIREGKSIAHDDLKRELGM